MRKLTLIGLCLGFMALGANPLDAQMQMAESTEVEMTATVVDMSCKVVWDLSGDEHRMCAQVCADNNIPLGLMSADGELYLPVSDGMPGTGANAMLRPHAEHTVQVKGKVIERAGIKTIIISELSM